MKNILLLIISLIIYFSFGLTSGLILILAILVSYFITKLNRNNHKALFIIALLFNIILLITTKLLNTYTSFIAPLGISYFTLQIIAYIIDTYQNKYPKEDNLINYALFITYIPHLFIGPISTWSNMKNNLNKKFHLRGDNFLNGLLRISWGLSKKFIIAGRLGIIINTMTSDLTTYNGPYVLLACLLYSIYLYADFSGGIDMVLGLSKIIDIDLEENFNAPYFSETIQEFWRKWHITLSNWLKNYVYIPLGGNKVTSIRQKINVLITFTISGLWHGTNYILWGLLNGLFVCLGNTFKTKSKFLNYLKTYFIISILWLFFIYHNPITAFKMFLTIFTNFKFLSMTNILNLGLDKIEITILFIFTLLLFIYDYFKDKIDTKFKKSSYELRLIILCTLLLLVIVLGIYGIGFNVETFIYSKF